LEDTVMAVAVRRPAVAGRFYAADPRVLSADIDRYLAEARASAGVAAAAVATPAPKMLLVPHAGFVYSGPVAAHAYALLASQRGRIRRVVLLGPTHRVALRGIAAPTVDAFDTPLGRVRLDRQAIVDLFDLPQILAHDGAHETEHSLEVQLPFLQTLLGSDFTLVPLAVGHVPAQAVAAVIERLWGGDETLIVISSDLSHYLPYAQAQAIDQATVQRVLQLDPALGHEQASGATPLAAALTVARAHGLVPRLLDLRNSGDTAGDRSRVVGYCAVAFEPQPANGKRPGEDIAATAGDDPTLGPALTRRARNAIAREFGHAMLDEPDHAALAEPGATFVTLKKAGALRGCIGSLQAHRLLEADVRHNAHAAAFRDTRFSPLVATELAALQIEVSLLGPTAPMSFSGESDALRRLRPGVDGVVLQWRHHRATFLPQVWEQLREPHAFIGALRRKAGLAADFWADDLTLARYEVRKFHEAPLR
jgi:MEMO1 family protein